jgi:hypothetical protein
MKLQQIVIPVAAVASLAYGYHALEWMGFFLVLGGLVMWALLHFTRMVKVLERAANRPIGHVDSAVMLNAKLKTGVNLMHVIALTRSLGELTTPKDQQPEVYRWRDNSLSVVTCVFQDGRLQSWALERPAGGPDSTADVPPAALGGPASGAP